MDENRFVDLWIRCGSRLGRERAAEIFREVVTHYGEPWRVYHTGDHIRHCLEQVDRIPTDYPDRDNVEMAIWFHDVIYAIGDPDNEVNSVAWFAEQAEGDLAADFVTTISRLIMATCHLTPPLNLDEQYVVDIDLSGFGLPWQAFMEDSQRVRDEFPDVSDADFFEAHQNFLGKLDARPHIYCTELFRSLYEDRARQNIAAKLSLPPASMRSS